MFASTGRLVLKSRSCLLEAAGKINARHAMTKPEIIGSIRSTYTRVVCMVCEEKGIEYVLTETPLRAPEIFAIHPFGKMPVLRHGDFVLFESKAIADYLDRSFPAPYVFPSEPRLDALTEQWVSLVNTLIDRTFIRTYLYAYIAPKTADGGPDRQVIEAVMPALREQMGVLDRAVAQNGYLVGEQFTFADINLLPILYRVRQAPEGAEALAAATHLARYYERHAARPSFTSTIPPSGPPRRDTPA
jgi:glutathione S-transferase